MQLHYVFVFIWTGFTLKLHVAALEKEGLQKKKKNIVIYLGFILFMKCTFWHLSVMCVHFLWQPTKSHHNVILQFKITVLYCISILAECLYGCMYCIYRQDVTDFNKGQMLLHQVFFFGSRKFKTLLHCDSKTVRQKLPDRTCCFHVLPFPSWTAECVCFIDSTHHRCCRLSSPPFFSCWQQLHCPG